MLFNYSILKHKKDNKQGVAALATPCFDTQYTKKSIFYFLQKPLFQTHKNDAKSISQARPIFTAIFGKEKSLEIFCFKTFSVVEAVRSVATE